MAKNDKLWRVDVIQATHLGMEGSLDPDDPTYPLRFLAEGDSWFTIGAIPSSNLLFELRLRNPAIVLNLGYPGDTIANLTRFGANFEFARRLASPQWASDWTAILMSGGGNDLIDWAFDLLLPKPPATAKPEACVDQKKLKKFNKTIVDGYKAIVKLRDGNGSPSKGKPIIVHTYDYPTPRPAPARFIVIPITNPWMYPAFQQREVPASLYIPITDYLLESLADTLCDLQKELPAFHVVRTLGLLERAELGAKGHSGDWHNEIHPDSDGYRKIARKLADEIHRIE